MNKDVLKKVVTVILILSIITLVGMLCYDYYDMKKSNNYAEGMVNEIDKIIEDNKKLILVNQGNDENSESKPNEPTQEPTRTIQLTGYEVYGKIKIDKIGIEYPIIEYKNEDALWKSICKISNNNIDGTGNLCLAGHNMRNLSMFGNLRRVGIGDIVKITNLYGEEFIYEIFEKITIDPSENDVLNNTKEPILTLVTCNDSLNKRVIVKGRLIR